MRVERDISVGSLLPEKLERLQGTVSAEANAHGAAALPGLAWRIAGDKAGEAVREAMDGGVYELFAKAWATGKELREYKNAEKHPASEKSVVMLGEHELSATLHPELTVRVGAARLPPLRLNVEFAAKVHAVALTVQGGRIREVSGGDCVVSVQVKCGETALHDAVKSTPLKLPGTLKLKGDGVAIL